MTEVEKMLHMEKETKQSIEYLKESLQGALEHAKAIRVGMKQLGESQVVGRLDLYLIPVLEQLLKGNRDNVDPESLLEAITYEGGPSVYDEDEEEEE